MNYAIGLDVGGSKITGVLMNERGYVLEKYKCPSHADQPRAVVLEAIVSVVDYLKQCAKKRNIRVSGIGIGVPGFVVQNKIRMINNIPCFEHTNLVSLLSKKLKTKVYLENDANCFALAEYLYGAGKGCSSLVGVIWGTGIGSGIVIDGKIHSGAIGGAGEFGHVVMDPYSQVRCKNCNARGDLESFASAKNMPQQYCRFGGKKAIDMFELMSLKDAAAKKTVHQAIDMLARALAFYVGIINPEIIVLGGGLSNASVYGVLNKTLRSYVPSGLRSSYRLQKHALSDDAGALGAAALALKKLK